MKIVFRTYIILSFLMVAMYGQAQNTLTGTILDEKGEPLTYSTITLLNPIDSTLKYFGVSKEDGTYKIKSIKSDNYVLQVSFVGMKSVFRNITVPSGQGEDQGVIEMSASVLDEVEIVAEYIPIQFKSDTVEFNANAFTNKPDAVVEDLLKKIPGIEVDESGNMKALGEDVTKVLVDGKEFFGKDPKVATKNLPAKAIEKIQVFDKKSEDAEFMGIDDGVRDRTINLILNEDNKQGYFGELEAGGGVDKPNSDAKAYYTGSGKIYRFSDKLQSAVLGMYNNINEFGYSDKRHGNWGQKVDGINTTGAGGLNFSYIATKQNRYFMSYLGRSTSTINEKETETEFFKSDGSYYQKSQLTTDELDAPHAINLGLRHNFNDRHKLTLDGDLNIETNNQNNSLLTNTLSLGNSVNNLDNNTTSNSDFLSGDARAVYIIKFGNEKTQMKTDFYGVLNENSSSYDLVNTSVFYDPLSEKTISQFQNNDTQKNYFSANPTLVQQLTSFWYLSTNVKLGMGKDQLYKEQGDQLTNILVDTLGADFTIGSSLIEPGISFKRNTAQTQLNISFNLGINSQDKTLFETAIGSNTWYHFLPGIRYENNYKKGRRFTASYNSNVNTPSLSQLLPVSNTINPQNIFVGNADLEPEYRHNVSLRWSIFDQFSFTSMFMRIGASYTQNKIGTSRTTTEDFIQTVSPINVAYQYSAYSFVYFTTPIRRLGIKLNIRLNESWNRGISVVDTEDNINTNLTHSIKANIENRKKEKWHLSFGGSLSLTNSTFSLATSQDNQYYNTSYFGEMNYTPSEKWNFEADGNVVNYNSRNFEDSFSIPILNAGISYFFWKGNKASISLKGFDLLDKNTSIRQITESNYVQQEESNTIGRRVMLGFKMKMGK